MSWAVRDGHTGHGWRDNGEARVTAPVGGRIARINIRHDETGARFFN